MFETRRLWALIIVLVLASGALHAIELDASFAVTETALVVLTGLTITPVQVNRGGSIDFSLSAQNKGNLQTTLQANVTMKNSTNDEVGQVSFGAVVLSPGETVVFASSWSTATLPIGDYTANAEGVYEGIPTNSLQEPFSIVTPAQPTPTPPPSDGGARPAPTPTPEPVVLPAPLPKEIKPVIGLVRFTRKVVLKEVLASEGSIESIELKNTAGNTQQVTISVSGVPTGFVSVEQGELVLLPGSTSAVNLAFSIPENALAGDYLAKIRVGNDETFSEDYLIVRVKAKHEGAITLKTVLMDERTKTTQVRLSTKNPSNKKIERIQLFERISPDIASNPSQITFQDKVGTVVSLEPLVLAWESTELQPGDTWTLTYIISALLSDYSAYVYWPVQQVVYSSEKAEGMLKIQEMEAPLMTIGEPATVNAVLFYGGLTALPVTAFFEAPKEFEVIPENKQLVLAPRSLTRVYFEVTPLELDMEGSHAAALVVSSQDETIRQSMLLVVRAPPPGINALGIGAAILAVVLVALAAAAIVRREGWGRERVLRKQAVEAHGKYLQQVRDDILEKD
ncbi:hypothetical protein COX85_00375 [Candidatus Micrarchaeota archaeon CG_4_10_14_0_2_um_filter_55_9]|nr:MAG: hypothetical protein COX85_00375 [Candidatus Micrarchaeota archaeon CG_4_10_14_0_2_um_filter_55_9]